MELVPFLIGSIFWATLVGALAARKNLRPWTWGIAGALMWPVALIALSFMSYRCTQCNATMPNKRRKIGRCETCAPA